MKTNLRNELQSIISGSGNSAAKNLIQAVANYLRESKKAGRKFKKNELFTKEHETEDLRFWIQSHRFWFLHHDESRYITRGAEQRVYLDKDERFVYKLNDTIFYSFWLDYFHSLLLHNFFFPKTAYELVGFFEENNVLYAVVKQPFIEITEPTDTDHVELFLNENGFFLKRNNDYVNKSLGLKLEDLHDENILTNSGVLFFVDTIFYLTEEFYRDQSVF